jgi:hypothetical protein
MIDLFQNPFSDYNFQSSRQTVGVNTPARVAINIQSSSLVSSSWNFKDEYVPSALSSSGTYKRSSISTVSFNTNEKTATAQTVEITDEMREEMKREDGSYWFAFHLLPVATQTFNEIFLQVLDEKGIDPVDFNQGYCSNFGISLDGIFMFAPDVSDTSVDPDLATEVCLALESAFNSSALNIKENPHLFTKGFMPPEYDPAEWGREIDREAWLLNREPDFSEFIKELRSDIFELFGDSEVVDFSMKIDDQGKLTITDVKTKGNNPTANALAAEKINSKLTYEIEKEAEYLGLLMLDTRNAFYGDVQTKDTILEQFDNSVPGSGNIRQFRQEVIITSSSGYKVIPSHNQQFKKDDEQLTNLMEEFSPQSSQKFSQSSQGI